MAAATVPRSRSAGRNTSGAYTQPADALLCPRLLFRQHVPICRCLLAYIAPACVQSVIEMRIIHPRFLTKFGRFIIDSLTLALPQRSGRQRPPAAHAASPPKQTRWRATAVCTLFSCHGLKVECAACLKSNTSTEAVAGALLTPPCDLGRVVPIKGANGSSSSQQQAAREPVPSPSTQPILLRPEPRS